MVIILLLLLLVLLVERKEGIKTDLQAGHARSAITRYVQRQLRHHDTVSMAMSSFTAKVSSTRVYIDGQTRDNYIVITLYSKQGFG